MTSEQFEGFLSAMQKHLSFKFEFDRFQSLADFILKSNNEDAINRLIKSTHSQCESLESIISNTLLDHEKH